MHQHQYRTMCSGLAAQNALLKSQLFADVKALRRERAASQAELQTLRQKVRSCLAKSIFSVSYSSRLLTRRHLLIDSQQSQYRTAFNQRACSVLHHSLILSPAFVGRQSCHSICMILAYGIS